AGFGLNREAVGAADQRVGLRVPARELHLPGQQRAGRAAAVQDVGGLGVALGRAVEFSDPLDPQALTEPVPNVRTQAIANKAADRVIAVIGPRGAIVQVPTKLANVETYARVGLAAFGPESAGREFTHERELGPGGDRHGHA